MMTYLLLCFFVSGLLLALISTFSIQRKDRRFYQRLLFLQTGAALVLISISGPLAALAHHSFYAHMWVHFLIGMLAPLFFVLGRGLSFFLSLLPTRAAKAAVRFLHLPLLRGFTFPAAALTLNLGGMAVLYLTPLYPMMMDSQALHWLVHIHFLAAGWLFTAVIVQTEPLPVKRSLLHRGAVLTAMIAGHGILSKYLYANPPAGVSAAEAASAAQMMYYSGDLVDVTLLVLLGWEWWRRREVTPAAAAAHSK
ncbi:cytochrome c oxidase assembly protein [Alkalicoccus urumqiensis]|uniref:Cytochrome c oxidase assembly protein n=1 Tax=Alkalicoccus urumqiensis TaxID=1548213 RepID=A0A2P6MLH5_ALKUR|nr:cytochrome c oxidase assembly protein [Alkalicoccus urumqiensis]PRO67129.1 hypothetical protein C6I21_00755 [Alkalicoccus urumqiensis]